MHDVKVSHNGFQHSNVMIGALIHSAAFAIARRVAKGVEDEIARAVIYTAAQVGAGYATRILREYETRSASSRDRS